jgi:hypothetical protein
MVASLNCVLVACLCHSLCTLFKRGFYCLFAALYSISIFLFTVFREHLRSFGWSTFRLECVHSADCSVFHRVCAPGKE